MSSKCIESYEDDYGDENKGNLKPIETLQSMEASSKGQVRGSVSSTYFTSGANFFVLTIIVILFILTQVLASGVDFWMTFW